MRSGLPALKTSCETATRSRTSADGYAAEASLLETVDPTARVTGSTSMNQKSSADPTRTIRPSRTSLNTVRSRRRTSNIIATMSETYPRQIHEVGNRRKRRRGRENVVVHDQDRVPGEMETDARRQPPQIGGALRPMNEDSTDASDECEDSDSLVADGLRGRPRVGEEVQRDHQRRQNAGRNDRQPRSGEGASSHVGS